MGEEFALILSNITEVEYAVFFDLMEDSSVDILMVTERVLPSGDTGT